jgi:hypothetical protein
MRLERMPAQGAGVGEYATAKDPQQLHGLFDDLLKPAGGPNNAGLSLDTPGRRISAGLIPGGPIATSAHRGQIGAVVHTPDLAGLPKDPFVSAPVPDVLGALPISDVSRTSGLSGLGAPAVSTLAPGLLPESAFAEAHRQADAPRLPLLETLLGTLGVPDVTHGVDPADLAAHPSNAVPVASDKVVHVLPSGARPTVTSKVPSSDVLPGANAIPGMSSLPGTGSLPGAGSLPGLGSLPAVPGLGSLPGAGDLPGLGSLPGAGDLPGAGALGATPVTDGVRNAGSVAPASRSAERPVAKDAPESLEQGIPAAPASALPLGGLPIFDSLPLPAAPNLNALPTDSRLPALGNLPGTDNLPALGNLPSTDNLPGVGNLPRVGGLTDVGDRHRAPSTLPATVGKHRSQPVINQVGGGRDAATNSIDLHIKPTLNPGAPDLPIFGALLSDGLLG